MKCIPSDMLIGTVHKTNNSGYLKITNYINATNVEVVFLDTNFIVKTDAAKIRKGQIKDKLSPSIFNVGFLGVGDYKPSINGIITKAYQVWRGMIERCYSEKLHKKYPTYIGCTVCDEWHNFQNFAKWFEDNYPKDGLDYQLDKDIKIDGNKLYSPSTCLFVTGHENISKASAKTHYFTNPAGFVVEIYNLKEFCELNNLSSKCMHNVASGINKSHKGWTKGL